MPERENVGNLVVLKDLTRSNTLEIASLIEVLIRKKVITKEEIAAEVARQKKGRV